MDGGGRSLGARALLALISVGPMSRGDLGERLGLSAATTTRTVRPLIEAGLIGKNDLVKILGNGTLSLKLEVEANAFSKSAEAAIIAQGGSAVKL